MRSVVVYESMFGNTRAVAEAIAAGLASAGEVSIMSVGNADANTLRGADLVVVGGPTHVHGLSRVATRRSAAAMAAKAGSGLRLEPDAQGRGVREWLASLDYVPRLGAAFDTRASGLAFLTGRASRIVGRRLRRHGLVLVARPESFLVTGRNELRAGEVERARAWGDRLAVLARERTPVLT